MASTAQPARGRGTGKRTDRASGKPASSPVVRKRRVARPTTARQQTSRDPRHDFSDEEWHEMVSTAAYFQAEARGFEGRSPDEDWYEAEALLREQLAKAEDEADEKAPSGLDRGADETGG
jgi:hypothetical protein